MMKIISWGKNEERVQLQKGWVARAKTDARKDNKNKKSRLLIIVVFMNYAKNSVANEVI